MARATKWVVTPPAGSLLQFRPPERDRLQRFLALQRDEYTSDPTSASLLVVKEQVFDSSPNGKTESEEDVDTKAIPELAAWTSVCRVLFNLDDFMTRE